jgi:hypothetical protein
VPPDELLDENGLPEEELLDELLDLPWPLELLLELLEVPPLLAPLDGSPPQAVKAAAIRMRLTICFVAVVIDIVKLPILVTFYCEHMVNCPPAKNCVKV